MTEAEEYNRGQAKVFEFADFEDVEFMFEAEEYEAWLNKNESKRGMKRSKRSVYSELQRIKIAFVGMGNYLSYNNLQQYKKALIDNDIAAATINSRTLALANYSRFLSEKYNNKFIYQQLRVKCLPTEPKQYIDNVISRADYDFMVLEAIKAKNPNIYLAIRIMGTTGVRMCELLQIKVEHIKNGYIDVLGKGAKKRRIYFPKRAQTELLAYLKNISGGDSGYVMRYWSQKKGEKTGAYEANTREKNGIRDTLTFTRSLQSAIKRFGLKIGLDESVLHPHGFRHFFAKEFLKHRLDISLLADLLGHSSLDITRIYLKMTSREQADVVNETVQW